MGYDIYGDGEVTIRADKVAAAGAALHAHCVKETIIETEVVPSYSTAKLLAEAIEDHTEHRFSANEITPTGDLLIQPDHDCGALRNIDDTKWVLDVLAPFADEGHFSWTGEDSLKWLWKFGPGGVEEVDSEVMYGSDRNAPYAIGEIVELLYPDGKSPAQWKNARAKLDQIADILRKNGFGPFGGLEPLDALAKAVE